MSDENVETLILTIEAEFNRLLPFLAKFREAGKSNPRLPDIAKLRNLFRGFKDWAKKRQKDYFLHPAKILDYKASVKRTRIGPRDKNGISTAVSRLKKALHSHSASYYKTEGRGADIVFHIEPAGKGGKYRLKALRVGEDVCDIVEALRQRQD